MHAAILEQPKQILYDITIKSQQPKRTFYYDLKTTLFLIFDVQKSKISHFAHESILAKKEHNFSIKRQQHIAHFPQYLLDLDSLPVICLFLCVKDPE